MATAVLNCPFCKAQSIAMPIFGHFPGSAALQEGAPKKFSLGAAACPNCNRPVGLRFFATDSHANVTDSISQSVAALITKHPSVTPGQVQLVAVIDVPPSPTL